MAVWKVSIYSRQLTLNKLFIPEPRLFTKQHCSTSGLYDLAMQSNTWFAN